MGSPTWFLQQLHEYFKEKAGKDEGGLPPTCCRSVLAGGAQGAGAGEPVLSQPRAARALLAAGPPRSQGTGSRCQAAALPARPAPHRCTSPLKQLKQILLILHLSQTL